MYSCANKLFHEIIRCTFFTKPQKRLNKSWIKGSTYIVQIKHLEICLCQNDAFVAHTRTIELLEMLLSSKYHMSGAICNSTKLSCSTAAAATQLVGPRFLITGVAVSNSDATILTLPILHRLQQLVAGRRRRVLVQDVSRGRRVLPLHFLRVVSQEY